MLVVKTYIDKSPIHGIGLFAAEPITKGTVIWELRKDFDSIITQEQFKNLPKLTQDFITHYSYFHKNLKCHILCSDNARFYNKSETPNCGGEGDDITVALKDIAQGEELTEIYHNLDELQNQ